MTAVGDKASPKERIVLGIFLIGFVLLGFSFVASSTVSVRGSRLPGDVLLSRPLLIASALVLAAAVTTAVRLFGARDGLRMIGREAWAGLLAGSILGGVVGFAIRMLVAPPRAWLAAIIVYVGGLGLTVWFANREASETHGGAAETLRAALLPSSSEYVPTLTRTREQLQMLWMTHPATATVVGSGADAGRQVLELVSRTCLEAIRALETGKDPEGEAIEPYQVGLGLGRLVADVRQDQGLLYTGLSPEGVQRFLGIVDGLAQVAVGLQGTRRGSSGNRLAILALVLLAAVPLVLGGGAVYASVLRAKFTTPPPGAGAKGDQGETAKQTPKPALKGKVVYQAAVGEDQRIFVLDLETGVETQLTQGPGGDYAPEWSHDGTRIAFTRTGVPEGADAESGLTGDLFVMSADGGDEQRVAATEGSEGGSAWSPDDTSLLTTTFSTTSQSTVGVMQTDGSGSRTILASDSEPFIAGDWSADGTRLVVLRRSRGELFDVVTTAADGSDERKVSPYPGRVALPQWSPDGARIAYLLGAPEFGAGLLWVGAEGSAATEAALSVNAFTWAPDGKSLLVAKENELRLIPLSGGEGTNVATAPHAPLTLSWFSAEQ